MRRSRSSPLPPPSFSYPLSCSLTPPSSMRGRLFPAYPWDHPLPSPTLNLSASPSFPLHSLRPPPSPSLPCISFPLLRRSHSPSISHPPPGLHLLLCAFESPPPHPSISHRPLPLTFSPTSPPSPLVQIIILVASLTPQHLRVSRHHPPALSILR